MTTFDPPRELPSTFDEADLILEKPVPVDAMEQLVALKKRTPKEFHEDFNWYFEGLVAITPPTLKES